MKKEFLRLFCKTINKVVGPKKLMGKLFKLTAVLLIWSCIIILLEGVGEYDAYGRSLTHVTLTMKQWTI